MTLDTEVEITRVPFTTPCPVRVNQEGLTLDVDGKILPDAERSEYCAVDAGWMIGAQRCCDVHLRVAIDLGGIEASFDGLLDEVFGEFGLFYLEQARERANRPWSERPRYTQDEARDWHERAKEKGLS